MLNLILKFKRPDRASHGQKQKVYNQ